MYVYIEKGRIELSRTPLLTNMTFVLLLFIQGVILCSLDLVYLVCYIVLLKLFR